MNTVGNSLEGTLRRTPYNRAFLHPDELAALHLEPGEVIEITSQHRRIGARLQSDERLRRGVVSIAHCWGAIEEGDGPGVNVNLLTRCGIDVQTINAMPRMSAIPVKLAKVAAPPGGQRRRRVHRMMQSRREAPAGVPLEVASAPHVLQ
jgi:anaerobic selenocysteine-containing dehydrogenase